MTVGIKPIDDKPSSMTEKEPAESPLEPPWRKLVFLVIGVGLFLTIISLSPLGQYLSRWDEVSRQIRGFGALAPLILMGSVCALVAVGFPRLVFCVIAGMTLGFWSGLFWAQAGTLLGNYVLFVVVRSGRQDWAQRFLARRSKLHTAIQQRGALGVILARQLPLPGLVINLACALLPISHLDFIVGTIIGQLPQAIPWTLIGAGALQASFGKSITLIGLAVIASILAWLMMRGLLRRGK
jgi:uncharacterized membrane protein YdjX (TVP38/TMEM64 family)